MMTGVDTETTGKDLRHGAKPYFVNLFRENQGVLYWEWAVDPETREPVIPAADVDEIEEELSPEKSSLLILQNPRFDVAALSTVRKSFGRCWRWKDTRDTLLAAHLIRSNEPHDLTSTCIKYLGIDISRYERALKDACNEARRIARSRYPTWRIAKAGLKEMPSAKQTVWKYDGWLPREIARAEGYPEDHPWWSVLKNYANPDPEASVLLYKTQERMLKELGLWKIYLKRLQVLQVASKMENRGITLNDARLAEMMETYQMESEVSSRICTNIAQTVGHDLILPKGSVNNSIRQLMFDVFRLPMLDGSEWTYADGTQSRGVGSNRKDKRKKSNVPSLSKAHIAHYEEILADRTRSAKAGILHRTKAQACLKHLAIKRKRDTAISYMESYRRFWRPFGKQQGWYVLHPSLNPTGTYTLRWSSSNPNEQNISKQEGFNLRYIFGPAPGREWWSLDAENIELRIPAYESGEEEMVRLFERPQEPPFFGSNHLLICSVLHPEKFAECLRDGVSFKDRYKSTWYQWTKNGNFAVTYGAVEESGTADRAYHMPGAQRILNNRFKAFKRLNDEYVAQANQRGYVETLPDKTVDPKRGYPLYCSRAEWGGVLPTVPLNYHVQGTAMWWMMKAMIRCQNYLDKLNMEASSGREYHLVMQVHDELVFDFPRGETPQENLLVILEIKRLMELGGEDISIPTPVSCEYHAENWAEGVKIGIAI